MEKVLVLDANQRPALAITRSLGQRGIWVVTADETTRSLAGSSKFCKESFSYPSPYKFQEKFIDVIKKEILNRNINVIFPVTDITTYIILKNKEKFGFINIPFAHFNEYEKLTNKWELFKIAQKLEIPCPKTYFIENYSSFLTLTSTLTSWHFPLVLKPFRSRIEDNGKYVSASVVYANSMEDLKEKVKSIDYFRNYPFLIQEYIEGEGRGIFTIYNQGIPVCFFAHRRLREKPPSGGVSVLSESIAVDPYLKKLSKKILDYVNWHGPAMVEFKVSKGGCPYLMEVNARFWGSLQLAIDSGVDFPWLLYQIAIGKKADFVNNYKIGNKSRWLLGDLDNLYLTFKNHVGFIYKIRSLINFLNFYDKNIHYEVNRWADMKPFFFELKRYLLG